MTTLLRAPLRPELEEEDDSRVYKENRSRVSAIFTRERSHLYAFVYKKKRSATVFLVFLRSSAMVSVSHGEKPDAAGGTEQAKMAAVVVREYEAEKDRAAAEAVDRMCEVGPSGATSLFTDHLGDPACRVRHSPAFLMLVRIGNPLLPPCFPLKKT